MSRHQGSARRWRCAVLAAIGALLVGCGGGNMADLHAFVAQVKKSNPGHIEPLPEIQVYETFAYKADGLRDPFEKPVSQARAKAQKAARANGISPDFNRPHEQLEDFPLDALRMVGTLKEGDKIWAIVKANDGTIHRVTTGNHMGENYGKITQITDSEIKLREIIPDGMGGWRVRPAALTLGQQ